MTPYLKRSAKACVRFEMRSEVKRELRNFMTSQVGERWIDRGYNNNIREFRNSVMTTKSKHT